MPFTEENADSSAMLKDKGKHWKADFIEIDKQRNSKDMFNFGQSYD